MTAIFRDLGGKQHKFELTLGNIRDLERVAGAGVGAIWNRIISAEFRIDDLRETIKQGLIGGGLSGLDAEAAVRAFVDKAPIKTYYQLAFDIVKSIVDGDVQEKNEAAPAAGENEAPAT